MPHTEFGPVTVVSVRTSATGKSCQVKLRQETTTTYSPEETTHLALQQKLSGDYDERVAHGKRTNTQTVSVQEAENMQAGQLLPGHIMRVTHATPQFDGHTVAYEGGYPLTFYVPEYQPDVDLRKEVFAMHAALVA